MVIQELGAEIRRMRQVRGLTQAQLAASAGLSRNTLNRLENGLFPDLGIRKAEVVLERLGLELAIKPSPRKHRAPDYVRMACTSASVSFRTMLTAEELVHALLSGRAPSNRQAHFIVLLEEGPVALLKGLLKQVGAWVKPGKVAGNLAKIAKQVGLSGPGGAWRRIG